MPVRAFRPEDAESLAMRLATLEDEQIFSLERGAPDSKVEASALRRGGAGRGPGQ